MIAAYRNLIAILQKAFCKNLSDIARSKNSNFDHMIINDGSGLFFSISFSRIHLLMLPERDYDQIDKGRINDAPKETINSKKSIYYCSLILLYYVSIPKSFSLELLLALPS